MEAWGPFASAASPPEHALGRGDPGGAVHGFALGVPYGTLVAHLALAPYVAQALGMASQTAGGTYFVWRGVGRLCDEVLRAALFHDLAFNRVRDSVGGRR